MKHLNKMLGGLAVAVLLAVTPIKADAQLLLGSSMTAECLDPQCTLVAFVLDVTPNVTVDWLRIVAPDTGPWRFAAVLGVTDSQGNPVTWNHTVYPDSIRLVSQGAPAPEPITIVIEMSASGTYNQLQQFTYVGIGNLTNAPWTQTKFEGSVVPEPTTMILLASGLVGLGAARRRRQRSKLGNDT